MSSFSANFDHRKLISWMAVAIILSLMVACFALGGTDSHAARNSTHNSYVLQDRVDLIEVNHFIDESGQVQLDQIIFYDWSPSQSRYIVRAWRSLKTPSQLPIKLPGRGFVATWHDTRDGNIIREVHAQSVIETWTAYDPETANQEYLDRNLRRELSKREALRWAAMRARRDRR